MAKQEEKKEEQQEVQKPKTMKEKIIAQVKEFIIVFGGFILLNNFVIASFLVPTGSMENEVMTGDFLMVNKFIYGASTPRNIMFTNIRLPWAMLPGFKDVKRGDVIVFEFPGYREEVNPPEFTYYLKRCMALAGDTLEIRNRVVYVNGEALPLPKNMKFNFNRVNPPAYGDERIFPPGAPFNEDNYGPIVIPQKGMVMNISSANFHMWETFIRRDGHTPVLLNDGTVLIDGKPATEYTVEKDYLFGMGDNRDNSLDSRFWGFIPRENIVGTPMFVYFSVASTDEFVSRLAMQGETMRMEWIYTTFSGHNLVLDFVSKVFLVIFNPEMIRFGRIGNVIG
jgi:signal peptidase I